ncbi:MAG TPA: DNA polymerase III subunit delta [Chloroflexota bacterium]|nr:DNA polymerase III subunit delta [Chloroflexota bacterium]
MIYLLYGGDEIARDEFLQRKLIDRLRALPGGEFNLDRFDGRTAALADVIACCQCAPFLAEKRMVIVDNLGARGRGGRRGGRAAERAADAPERAEGDDGTEPDAPAAQPAPATGKASRKARGEDGDLQAFWAFLPNLPESTHLVLVEERAPTLPSLPKGLLFRQEFPAPKPWELAGWVTRRARARGMRLDRGVADTLATLVGADLRRLDNELAKLALYCGAQPVREADVRRLVAPAEANVFALLDGVADGRPGPALAALRRLLQQGQAVEALLPQLIALVRRLLVAHELAAAGRSVAADGGDFGLTSNPRALEKLVRQASRYQRDDFEHAYALLLACDRAVKTGEDEPEVAVELLVAELAGV